MSQVAPSLDRIIEKSQLPALPQSAVSLLKISQDPDCGPNEFAAPIEADIGLTSQILRFVNSSYFGFAREIGSIRHAITLVGVRTIKNFALWNAVFSLIPDPKCGPFQLKSLWQDSLRRGLFSRALAKALRLDDSEDVFAATLLQDMSLPLLAKSLTSEYEELFNARENGQKRMSDLELERFGWCHADVGAKLAQHWGLPESFGELIATHTRPVDSPELASSRQRQIVALASMLPSSHDPDWMERGEFCTAYDWMTGGKAPGAVEVFDKVDREFGEFAPLLNLPGSPKNLVESLTVGDETPAT